MPRHLPEATEFFSFGSFRFSDGLPVKTDSIEVPAGMVHQLVTQRHITADNTTVAREGG